MRSVPSVTGVLALLATVLVATPPSGAAGESCQGQAATIVVPRGDLDAQGTAGDDVIYVAGTGGQVDALGGDDVVCTARGSVTVLLGGDGEDRLTGAGDLLGGAGNDVLRATAADEWQQASGGEGNDRIVTSGRGHHDVRPGPGNDTVVARGTSPEWDWLQVSSPTDGLVVDAAAGTLDGEGHDTYRGRVVIFGTTGRDVFRGASAGDRFVGHGGGDRIRGGGGRDRLSAEQPRLVDGGAGDDRIRVAFGGTAHGGAGDDVLTTGMRTDSRRTDVRAYRLSGGPGHDVFRLQSRRDEGRIVAGHPVTGTIAGGAGADTADFRATGADVRAGLREGRASWRSGGDRLGRVALASIEALTGGAGDDRLLGDGRANSLAGRGGDDLLVGRAGRDRAAGGPGRDTCRSAERSIGCERR